MSEISLNVAPSPELLKAAASSPTAAPGRALPLAGEAAGAPNPFAALLSGVLQGAQPPAENPLATTSPAALPDLLPEADPNAGSANLTALPGTAPSLPAPLTTAAGDETSGLAGNLLPAGGKELPPQPDATRTAASSDATPRPAAGEPASRPRIFLGDLAQSRPVEPTPELPLATAADGSRSATAAALAGRSPSSGANLPVDTPSRARDPAGYLATPGSNPLQASATSSLRPVPETPAPGSAAAELPRGTSLPGTGVELLSGQLAAFASSNEGATAGGGTPALAGGITTDAGSAALLSRLGNTGLPPLQPFGDAGAFAGGLADRLLTLGGPGSHSARLKLHPEHLGELDVEISIEDGNAQVWFGTMTSQARDAIESTLPRLRELFAEQGIQLTRTQVDAGGAEAGNSGFGQERRMTGGAGAWSDPPGWQRGRTGAGAEPAGRIAAGPSARLLDVWA